MLLAALPGLSDIIPLFVFMGIVLGDLGRAVHDLRAQQPSDTSRLERFGRQTGPDQVEDPALAKKGERFQGIADMAKAMSDPMMPKTDLEQSKLKTKLANAGFRSEAAPAIYSGVRLASLLVFLVLGLSLFVPNYGFSREPWCRC